MPQVNSELWIFEPCDLEESAPQYVCVCFLFVGCPDVYNSENELYNLSELCPDKD